MLCKGTKIETSKDVSDYKNELAVNSNTQTHCHGIIRHIKTASLTTYVVWQQVLKH